jgi:hypothetical protein
MTPHLWTVLFIFWSLFAIPAALILKKLGRNPAWALLAYFTPLAIIGIWVLALTLPSRSSESA